MSTGADAGQEEAPLTVQVWSDYICPFCHIGRERIAYLEREHGAQVQWFPFDLHPEYPEDGILRAALVATYGQDAIDRVAALAAESGMPHNPNADVVPNSRKALELAEWARGFGPDMHRRLHDALMDAYWRDGRDIGDWAVLEDVANSVGLDGTVGRQSVQHGAFRPVVDDSTQWAHKAGITGVPAMVLDGRMLISGVVPHEQLDEAIRALRETPPEQA